MKQAKGLMIKPEKRRKSLFSAVTPRKIPDVVYKQLVTLITKGHLKPGDRLPSERAMALDLGVSRQSIREGILRAKTAGLVQVRQGGGAFVISSLPNNLRPALSILLEEQAGKVLEFLEIRRVIEKWCAETASETATPADLRKMQGILKRMERLNPPETAWEEMDLDFHSCIAGATHNVVAMHVMEGLKDSFHTYFRVKKFTTKPERKGALVKQHRAVFEAIRKKNPREAGRKIREHLTYVERMIKEDLLKRK